MDDQRTLLLGLLRLLNGRQWAFVAREAREVGSVQHLVEGKHRETSKVARGAMATIHGSVQHLADACSDALRVVDAAVADGLRITTILDSDYPENLRSIDQAPPFLFYRGTLQQSDCMALSVVGTRRASDQGLKRAAALASMLGRSRVTVVSGLARGVDTAAHEACLGVGGRTIGVLGAGHWHFYPPENSDLAVRMAANGAVVSQFWPDTPPSRKTFPIRNAVSSGLSLGTVVIEASQTSGAKMQARLALEQGRTVFLPQSLVDTQEWARSFLARGAVLVPSVEALQHDLELKFRCYLGGGVKPSEVDEGEQPTLFAVG